MRLLFAETPNEIMHIIEAYKIEAEAIKKQLRDLVWYSDGKLGYSEAYTLSAEERKEWFDYLADRYNDIKGKESIRQELI